MTVTHDETAIAKELATYCYGSSQKGLGSHWNPDALTDNCVFVCLAFLLGMTAPELSRITGEAQPINGKPMQPDEIWTLLMKVKEKGLAHTFQMSETPFEYDWKWAKDGDMILYERPNSYRHCVVGNADFQRDLQHSPGGPSDDTGMNVSWEITKKNPMHKTIMVAKRFRPHNEEIAQIDNYGEYGFHRGM